MIYFIGCKEQGTIKVGFSSNPLKRLRSLQTANAGKLELLLVLDYEQDMERKFHERWADRRLSGEWFKVSPTLLLDLIDIYEGYGSWKFLWGFDDINETEIFLEPQIQMVMPFVLRDWAKELLTKHLTTFDDRFPNPNSPGMTMERWQKLFNKMYPNGR